MLTSDIRNKIDAIWNAFWLGGISNPLEIIEQITYLLFLRRLDDLHTLEENRASRLGTAMERRIFPQRLDAGMRHYEDLRWSRFKNFATAEMYQVVDKHAFPFLTTIGGDVFNYGQHLKDARFTIPTPALLAKVVNLLADLPMEVSDPKGELYEYMLSKVAPAGHNPPFWMRWPVHSIRFW